MTQTVGEIRAAVASLGERAWTVAPHLRDDEIAPQYSLGGEIAGEPLASDVASLDRSALTSRVIANPMLRARNAQVGLLELDLAPMLNVDWRDRWGGRWLATVQTQGPCLSCWAFTAAALVETMVRIEHGVWAKRSEGDLRDGWGGATGQNWIVRDGVGPCAHSAGMEDAFAWVQQNGIADPACYAWSAADRAYAPTADRNGRTVRIPALTPIGSVDDAMFWLDTVGPITCSFDVYPDFESYGGPDIYHQAPAQMRRGNHKMLIVGYDELGEAWLVRNSWGTGWGMGGYGLIGFGECEIDKYAKHGLRGTNPDPWSKRRVHAGNFFESGNGPGHRNFELVRASAPRALHLWRDGGDDGFRWHEAATLENPTDVGAGAGCVGQPATTSTTYNRNFEAVYWEASGRLRHWYFDQNDQHWHDAGQFGPSDTEGFSGFIQSNYGAPGNLEVVVRRRGGVLTHWWRDGPPSNSWHDGGTIATDVRMSGPSLVQSDVGTTGNFYVVAVTNFGSMQMYWRDDDGDKAWHPGEVFGSGVGETPPCMIQGGFGATDELTSGNFELCVAVDGRVEHWWRDNSTIATNRPREDIADPRLGRVIEPEKDFPAVSVPDDEFDNSPLGGLLGGASSSTTIADSVRASIGSAVLAGSGASGLRARFEPARRGEPLVDLDRWHRAETFGHDVKHVWGLVQGSFGFNLEVIVETTDGGLQHYFRDGEGWHEAEPVIAV